MLTQSVRRRDALRMLAGASVIPLVGCSTMTLGLSDAGSAGDAGSTGSDGSSPDGGSRLDAGGTESCTVIPEETAGPYPGDGTNGANALALSGIVRSDLRSSLAGATGVALGVPLTVTLRIVQATATCAPLAGYAVYLWHCDRDGNYSMYSAAVASENYLRGAQETSADGLVTFTTIFPGCYAGRWPHMHFEIYPSLASATNGRSAVATSQLALPEDACHSAFASEGYAASVGNFAAISLATDNVFRDGSAQQLPTMSGSATAGYSATLTIGISG